MIGPILRRAEAGRLPTRREIMLMLQAEGSEYPALLDTARRICHRVKGEEPLLRGLIRISDDAVIDLALEEAVIAQRLGCTSVVIRQDGFVTDVDLVANLVRQIREQTDLEVALCMGERSYDTYATWRQAGATEYILPHECSSASLYAQIHPGRSPADRLTRYLWLRGLGYRVGGGMRIDLIGRTKESLADDLEVLRNADVGAVVIRGDESPAEALRLIAIARLCLPEVDLWLATDDPELQNQALSCGASLLVTQLPGNAPALDAIPIALAQAL